MTCYGYVVSLLWLFVEPRALMFVSTGKRPSFPRVSTRKPCYQRPHRYPRRNLWLRISGVMSHWLVDLIKFWRSFEGKSRCGARVASGSASEAFSLAYKSAVRLFKFGWKEIWSTKSNWPCVLFSLIYDPGARCLLYLQPQGCGDVHWFVHEFAA